SSASKVSSLEHCHHGAGDEPSFRMEDLPAEILPVIISLLPLKEAVRTSIVSTSWKMLWTFHCNLCFYGPNELDDDPSVPPLESDEEAAVDEYVKTSQAKLKMKQDKFIEAVNCVIQRHSRVGINKFSIRCGLHKEEFYHLDRWIGFAASSKAKIVDFDLKKIDSPSREVHQFPLEALVVQGSSCVQSLYLADVSIKPHPGIFGFTLLRRLVLEFVEIFRDFSGFLANCSALEDLELIECSGVTNLSIPHQLDKLQHLLIDRMAVETVESNAADLAHFEYKGKEIPIVLHGRSKLEMATIMFEGSNGLARAFTAVPIILRVKVLNVQAQISAYEQLQKLAPRPCGMFMHLRHMTCGLTVLSLKKPNSDNGVLQLVHCLNVAPLLQTLHLDMIYSYFKASAPAEVAEEEGPHMHHHGHLKTVHISGFRCYKAQAELACCILENARVLDHMELQPRVAAAICSYADLKNFAVERRFLPGVREWAQLASERFGKAITVLDAPSE
ncbi:hypothetical protein CFC21_105679, partial [Triticum aestivum]|uniref:F-box domain-containing protein n=2 Tax=Triticum aestivum TaxID=4565 RepID=A0A3B6SPI9_WHEAT